MQTQEPGKRPEPTDARAAKRGDEILKGETKQMLVSGSQIARVVCVVPGQPPVSCRGRQVETAGRSAGMEMETWKSG